MPPAQVPGIRAALKVVREDPQRRAQLAENAAYFRSQLRGLGLYIGPGPTHVVPIIVGDDRELLFDAALRMMDRGLYVVPIDYPAVPEEGLRFRTAVTSAHSRAELDEALTIVSKDEEMVRIGWRTVAAGHPDAAVLRVLDRLLDDARTGLLDVELELPRKVQWASSNLTMYREGG